MDAVVIVEGEVRELIRRRGVDPSREPDGVRRLVEEAVADYDDRSLSGGLPPVQDPGATVKWLLDSVASLGPLQQYLDDPRVEEVCVKERPTDVSVRYGMRVPLSGSVGADAHGTAAKSRAPCSSPWLR